MIASKSPPYNIISVTLLPTDTDPIIFIGVRISERTNCIYLLLELPFNFQV